MNVRWFGLGAVTCAAIFAGCGGGGSSGVPSVPVAQSGGSVGATTGAANPTPPPGAVAGSISVVIPRASGTPLAQTDSSERRPQYISPGGAYLAVQASNGKNVNGPGYIYGVTSASALCTAAPTGTACTLPFYSQPGTANITVAELDANSTGGLGLILSENYPSPVPIVAGKSNAFSTTMYGVVRSFSTTTDPSSPSNSCPLIGAATTGIKDQTWLDDAGYAIDGALWAPVTLADINGSGAYSNISPSIFQLPSPNPQGSVLPPQVIYAYDGAGYSNMNGTDDVGIFTGFFNTPDQGKQSALWNMVTPLSTLGPHEIYIAESASNDIAVFDICSRPSTAAQLAYFVLPGGSAPKRLGLHNGLPGGWVIAPGNNSLYHLMNLTPSPAPPMYGATLAGTPVREAFSVESPAPATLYISDTAGIERIPTASATPNPVGTPWVDANPPGGTSGTAGYNGMQISSDGTKLYVAEQNWNRVAVFSTSTGGVVATIPVASGPTAVSISHDGSTIAVIGTTGNAVTFISTATNAVTQTLPVTSPQSLTSSNSGTLGQFFVANASGQLSEIVPASGTWSFAYTQPIFQGITVHGMAASPVSNVLYLTGGNHSLQFYSRATGILGLTRGIFNSPENVTTGS